MKKFIVFTYFGKVLKTFEIMPNETHHSTLKRAREFILNYENLGNNRAWLKVN